MSVTLILLLLSALGALDATYLTFAHLFGSGVCASGSGCGEVMASPYSKLFGIPLSTYGLGLYLAILLTAWRGLRPTDRDNAIRLTFLLAAVGIIPTGILIYLQAAVIKAWCPFCVGSAVLMTLLLIVSARERSRLGSGDTPSSSRELVPVALAIILPTLLYIPLHAGVGDASGNRLIGGTEVVARIGTREITAAEVDRGIRLKHDTMRNGLREEWIDRQVLEAAAAERGMEVREFVQKVIFSSIEITPQEIDRRYKEIKARLRPGTTKESVASNIRSELGNKKNKGKLESYVKDLRAKYGTVFRVPISERFAFDPNPRGGPEKGSPDAPVTIVEFSDFECSYCARAHTQLKSLIDRRSKDVRVIFRHLPLDMHEHARHAAEVAACANKQGKFWELADLLFKEQTHLDRDKIREHATTVGVNLVLLDACLESGEGGRIVQADIADAHNLGISSTPTFFINGHHIGSMPQGGLDPLIDQELGAK